MGWFLIDRKFFNHFLWTEHREYSKAEAWLDLICQARYKDEKPAEQMINGQLIKWHRGQLIASIRFLRKRWNWASNTKVETFLQLLEREDMIHRNVGQGITRITICNYDTYQLPKDTRKDTDKTPKGQAEDKTVKKEVNKDGKKEVSAGALALDVPPASDPETWEASKRIAHELLDAICEYDSTHRYTKNPPALSSWFEDIDRAMRRDGRTEKQLSDFIDFLFRSNHKVANFWAPNIQSGGKLRDQFDTVKNQLRQEQNGKSNTGIETALDTIYGED